MTESTERPLYTIIGLIIAGGLLWIILSLVFTQGALGAVTESKQAMELEKLLGAIKSVCGDSNHPETTVTITVFGEHEIIYQKIPANFGEKKGKSAKEAGCGQNCLCAFSGDEAVQCISMYSQEETGCQDIDIQEDHLVDEILSIPQNDPLFGLPDATCQFKLKLKWYGGSDNVILVESIGIQMLSYTAAEEDWVQLDCDF